MTWIVIILIVIILGALFSSEVNLTTQRIVGSHTSSLRPYQEAKLYFNVKGIWADVNRIEEFRKIRVGDILNIQIDSYPSEQLHLVTR